MLKILRDRFIRLGRDEDGVALVVTLGVFMFLYVVCASVYAVGWAVKEKLHLQGACDAAAYSAAIVQADTFSRIATINRAMSWTYSQMCKRQMDYIVYRWLEHACDHYRQDNTEAKNWARGGDRIGGFWMSDINLNDTHLNIPESFIRQKLSGMSSFNLTNNRTSFYGYQNNASYGIGVLEGQIKLDKQTIRQMNRYLRKNLIGDLPTHVDNAVDAVLKANIPTYMDGQCCYLVRQSRDPSQYFSFFRNTPQDEADFRAWGDDASGFGTGSETWEWFTQNIKQGEDGLQRSYVWNSQILHADWSWNSWHYHILGPGHPIRQVYHGDIDVQHGTRKCPHRGECSCGCTRQGGHTYRATCRPNCSALRDAYQYYYIGERAYPRKLTRDYFCSLDRDRSGTITVGLVRRRSNPWGGVLGRIGKGVYSAFNLINDTWCFASAKAGYKLFAVQDDEERIYNGEARAFRGGRDYCIDWKETIHTRTRQVVQRTYTVWIKMKIGDREVRVPRYVVRDVWEKPIYMNGIVVGWVELTDRPVYDKDGNFLGWNVEWRENTPGFRRKRYELPNGWRQSWNLTQSDWDAVMLPVRQAGSGAQEIDSPELRLSRYGSHQGWMDEVLRIEREMGWRHDEKRRNVAYRYEPRWGSRNTAFIRDLVYDSNWKQLNRGAASVPVREIMTTDVYAGPIRGDRGDTLNGRLAGDLWFDHWYRNAATPTATGTSLWEIEHPGARLDWNRIGDEMYH